MELWCDNFFSTFTFLFLFKDLYLVSLFFWVCVLLFIFFPKRMYCEYLIYHSFLAGFKSESRQTFQLSRSKGCFSVLLYNKESLDHYQGLSENSRGLIEIWLCYVNKQGKTNTQEMRIGVVKVVELLDATQYEKRKHTGAESSPQVRFSLKRADGSRRSITSIRWLQVSPGRLVTEHLQGITG